LREEAEEAGRVAAVAIGDADLEVESDRARVFVRRGDQAGVAALQAENDAGR
jgi:hypothetical protein